MTPGTRIFTGGGCLGAVILGVFLFVGLAIFMNWLQDTPGTDRWTCMSRAQRGLHCDGSEMRAIDHTYNTAGHER